MNSVQCFNYTVKDHNSYSFHSLTIVSLIIYGMKQDKLWTDW